MSLHNTSKRNLYNQLQSAQSQSRSVNNLNSVHRSNKKTPPPTSLHIIEQKTYDQRLLRQDHSQLDIYDPFQTPPNFLKAERHHLATSIGIPVISNTNIKDIDVCPCCQNPINKQPISICWIGYPLYYKLTKYIAYIILLVFMVSGSALYFLVTLNCSDKCMTFLGFKIINFQPEQQSSRSLEFFNMLTAIGIFFFVLYIKSKLNQQITVLETKVVCPSQYTIMLQNLPHNYEQSQLHKWILQTFESQCTVINIGYNITELQQCYQKRNSLTIELQKLYIKQKGLLSGSGYKYYSAHSSPSISRNINTNNSLPDQYIKVQYQQQFAKQKQLLLEIQKCDRIINLYKNNQTQCRKNGTAFVTFESVQTVEKILQDYQKSRMGYFFSSALSMMMRNNKLQFKDKIVLVNRAPAPRQIIWQNLQYSHFKSLAFQIFFFISMFILIYTAFKYQFKFSAYSYKLRTQGVQTGSFIIIFQGVVVSLIVVVLNSLLRIIIYIFTKLKRYHSYTSQQKSFCFYYSLMYIFNSCFMIYIVHGQYPQQTNELLLFDIHFIMLANAFSQPLFKLLDPIMWYKITWKQYIKSLTAQKNPYTQMYVNKYFQGHQISNGDNYQYIARILVVSIWFAHPAPLGVVFCLIGLFIDYWIGKILLLRVYKKPENISKSMGAFIINSFQLLPLVYIMGVLQFTYKSTSSKASIIQFLTNFFQYSITVSVLIICILGYLIFFKTKTTVIPQKQYSQIKNYFGFNYQTQNPITKFKGQINYVTCIVKDLKLTNLVSKSQSSDPNNPYDKQFFKMVVKLGGASQMDLDQKRVEMGKVKIKMVSSIEMEDGEEIEMNDMSDKGKKYNYRNDGSGSGGNGQNYDVDQFTYSLSSASSTEHVKNNNSQNNEKKKFRLKKTASIFV